MVTQSLQSMDQINDTITQPLATPNVLVAPRFAGRRCPDII